MTNFPMQYSNSMPIPSYPQYGSMNMRPQFVPSTNKQFVRSLEEALSLPANLNSQNVYFDANKDLMYDICTNGQGEKSWNVFKITMEKTAQPVQVSSDNERLDRIEKILEDLVNGKYNVKQTDSTNE